MPIFDVKARFLSLSQTLQGILIMAASAAIMTGMQGGIRHVATDLPPLEAAFFRNIFGFVALSPWFFRYGVSIYRTSVLRLHLLRGIFNVFAMTMFFYGLTMTSLVRVAALNFTAPLFATVLAIAFLAEQVRARRVIALGLGFLGVVVTLRPGVATIDLGSLLIIGSSLSWAVALTYIKLMTRTESAVTITAYASLFLTIFSFGPALWVWQWPTPDQWIWLLGIGVFGTFGSMMTVQALKLADTGVIMPVEFTKLIWASVLGFYAFGEVPDLWAWIGGSIVFGSTAYIAYRESRQKHVVAIGEGKSAQAGKAAQP